MDYYSIYFLLFFVTVFLLNYVISSKHRKYLIFAASSVFILSFNLLSLIVVFLVSVIFYFLARFMNDKNHSVMLLTGILISIAAFISFKYLNSIGDTAILKYSLLFERNTDYMSKFVFPVGISFYLFQNRLLFGKL